MKFKPLLLTLALILALSLLIACQPLSFLRPATSAGPFLTLFVEPEAGEAPVLEALNGAQKSICLKVYLLTNPHIIEALKGAVQRGVSVRMILELNPYGGAIDPNVVIDLRDNGVELKGDSLVFNYTHEKSMVIDDEVAFIMTGIRGAMSWRVNR